MKVVTTITTTTTTLTVPWSGLRRMQTESGIYSRRVVVEREVEVEPQRLGSVGLQVKKVKKMHCGILLFIWSQIHPVVAHKKNTASWVPLAGKLFVRPPASLIAYIKSTYTFRVGKNKHLPGCSGRPSSPRRSSPHSAWPWRRPRRRPFDFPPPVLTFFLPRDIFLC